jgi:iron complex outermembrane receptor protein
VLSAEDGSFLLKNIKEENTLLVSFVGLKQQTQIVEIKSGETHTIDFKLPENASQLTEVVVAYSKGINEKPVTVGKVNIKPMDLPSIMVVKEI